jgi:hypothetical protein
MAKGILTTTETQHLTSKEKEELGKILDCWLTTLHQTIWHIRNKIIREGDNPPNFPLTELEEVTDTESTTSITPLTETEQVSDTETTTSAEAAHNQNRNIHTHTQENSEISTATEEQTHEEVTTTEDSENSPTITTDISEEHNETKRTPTESKESKTTITEPTEEETEANPTTDTEQHQATNQDNPTTNETRESTNEAQTATNISQPKDPTHITTLQPPTNIHENDTQSKQLSPEDTNHKKRKQTKQDQQNSKRQKTGTGGRTTPGRVAGRVMTTSKIV